MIIANCIEKSHGNNKKTLQTYVLILTNYLQITVYAINSYMFHLQEFFSFNKFSINEVSISRRDIFFTYMIFT